MTRWLDSEEAAKVLGVTGKEFYQLRKNPTFPKYRGEFGLDDEWKAEEIEAFARELDDCAARGWKVPDCLYPWEFKPPPSVLNAERWEKVLARRAEHEKRRERNAGEGKHRSNRETLKATETPRARS